MSLMKRYAEDSEDVVFRVSQLREDIHAMAQKYADPEQAERMLLALMKGDQS